MKNILNRPYDLLESKVFRYLFVFGGSGFAFIFLWIFEPYGLYNLTTINEKILAIGLYAGIGLILMLVYFFMLQSLVIKDYTVIKTIGWIILSFLIIGTSSSIINSYLYNNGQFNLKGFFYFQGIILSINIIPVSIFVLIHYNITLRKRLKVASNINSTLDKRVESTIIHKPIVLNSENKKEGLTIEIDSLIFICSVDNYIEVYFLVNNIVEKRILRYSLSGVEKDNSGISEIFRCHKSYIINKRKISSITGNAAGYKIILLGYNTPIPVSRKWNKDMASITT
ncbi:MAG: LytTR family transcriptional regulator DNA-binding domain-containing protein [Bacteroidales bacterium]|nr:LytTR family transcriptional regulator DNA-binding domain-containing protein [Bacteroidales bacterium]